jgi:hypothetical protein
VVGRLAQVAQRRGVEGERKPDDRIEEARVSRERVDDVVQPAVPSRSLERGRVIAHRFEQRRGPRSRFDDEVDRLGADDVDRRRRNLLRRAEVRRHHHANPPAAVALRVPFGHVEDDLGEQDVVQRRVLLVGERTQGAHVLRRKAENRKVEERLRATRARAAFVPREGRRPKAEGAHEAPGLQPLRLAAGGKAIQVALRVELARRARALVSRHQLGVHVEEVAEEPHDGYAVADRVVDVESQGRGLRVCRGDDAHPWNARHVGDLDRRPRVRPPLDARLHAPRKRPVCVEAFAGEDRAQHRVPGDRRRDRALEKRPVECSGQLDPDAGDRMRRSVDAPPVPLVREQRQRTGSPRHREGE